MRKIITLALFLPFLLLAGCGVIHPYQPNIQQGNLVSPMMIDNVRLGMSQDQVIHTLGNPVLSPSLGANHWAYVYTFQHNGGEIARKNLDVYFQNGRVSHIEKSEGKIARK